MKIVSLNDYNSYLKTKADLDFYFNITFENLDYFCVADDFLLLNLDGKLKVVEDKFSSVEFQEYVYKPFFEGLKTRQILEGEIVDDMFEYTCAKTIRASKDNIYIMLHAGDKEMFKATFEEEVINNLNKKAYDLFDSVDNSTDRTIYDSVEKEVLQFIKDYGIED